ncbi:beta-ketoacyl-[acyl-carrier-protein] synthase family protein [Nannocystis bainbridge]|uniref:Beta-ketoacyl-[acyl-carrier-protein] synthase family protein n=1 Tax=Nannocystis bainbridge TaxID=2995303 RepID=A0ABT5E3F9_9BACT|nr:beta-ketoacyl-[acyl-carrier-protein] synthase family protein [Nannocystis bainbridge]MDC0719297.1 beta-ketoacyl-[acyl-carrier-protein] synthase family protein [Nannocystis bainbridge]
MVSSQAQSPRRVVITGLGINTPLGDDLDTFYANLVAGKSAITRWKWHNNEGVYSKIGGDLSQYDVKAKLERMRGVLPAEVHKRARQLCNKAPFSTSLSVLCAADAWRDAGMVEVADPTRCAVLVGGHNLNERYFADNYVTFQTEDPDYIDSMAALHMLDTDHAGSVSEMLGWKGACYTLGGACASANVALRNAIDEIRHHDHDMAMVVGAVLDFSQMGVHAMALLGAITFESFNDTPELASRPYDSRREGFVPSHGAGALVLEELGHALKRGATIYAEVLGCTSSSDGCHLPSPSTEGQARTIERLLRRAQVRPDEIDFVSAHATSTPLGDLSELNAIRKVFGAHAKKLKINAPKSMLGHTCWSAPAVETVAAMLQMRGGVLHPSINIDQLDPEVDVDVCANQAVEHRIELMVKNSFGFGGLNCCALYRRWDPNAL